MQIYIGAWYNEPGISFEFTYKVFVFITKNLREKILILISNNHKFINYDIQLTKNTYASSVELELKGPSIGRRNKSLNYGLTIPYFKVINSEKPLEVYLDYYFEGLTLLFLQFDISKEIMEKFKKEMTKEILNTPEFLEMDT